MVSLFLCQKTRDLGQELRNHHLNPRDFVEWLAQGDVYVILGHIHQALQDWNVTELYDLVYGLTSYRGFPQHRELRCPIFTQNKFDYIRACHDITIPTLKIDLQQVPNEYKLTLEDLSNLRGINSRDVEMSALQFMEVSHYR